MSSQEDIIREVEDALVRLNEPEPIINPGGALRPDGPAPICRHRLARQWVSGDSSKGQSLVAPYAWWACVSSDGEPCKSQWFSGDPLALRWTHADS